MQETPLQLAITKLEEKVDTSAGLEQIIAYQKALEIVKSLLPYEQKDRRDVAEKAIYHGFEIKDCVSKEERKKYVDDYLNQNHPL